MKTIKRVLLALLIVFVSWQLGYGMTKTNSLIILDYRSGIDNTESAIALVSKHCGEIYHVFRGKVLIGYIPEDKVNLLVGKSGILNVFQNTTLPNEDDALVNSAIKAFNSLLQPEELTQMGIREKPRDEWRDDVRTTYPTKSSGTGLSDRFTSEYMIGRVAVGIVIVEGNGDPQYDWTQDQLDWATTAIIEDLDWLANKASESNSNVCWFYDWHYSVPVPEEPIEGPSGFDSPDEGVISWIGWAMLLLGYNPGALIGDYFIDGNSAVYDYVHDIRRANGTDWAFAMFVAHGWTFADGYSAWANRWNDGYWPWTPGRDHGGPYLVLTKEFMYVTASHETFHMFGAADEYHRDNGDCRDSESCDDKHGYLQIENRNCVHCDGSIPCKMISSFSYAACGYTRFQAGWRDSDGDGPADPIDPNSGRFITIHGVQPGDRVEIRTIDWPPEFVKFIAVTPDNMSSWGETYAVMWDGTNAWGAVCAPGIYYIYINDDVHTGFLTPSDLTIRPIFRDVHLDCGMLSWSLQRSWAYVRCKIYDSGNNLVLYPIKDKLYEAKYPSQYQIDLYGLIENHSYMAEFFGWCPDGRTSDLVEYAFVYTRDMLTSPIGGEQWEAQSIHDVTWNTVCFTGNVGLRYTKDGENWYGIVESTENDGVYSWTLPSSAITRPHCRVEVKDAVDWIPYDISDDFTITPGPLYAPTNLSFSTGWGYGIRVQWTDNNSNELGYKIERKDSTNWIWEEIVSTEPNATWFQDTINLVGSEVYWYRIRAYNEAGYSPYSEEKWKKNRPNPPSNFTAKTLCDNSNLLFLSWELPENQKIPIEYYQLYITDLLKGDCERWFYIYGLADTLCLDHDLEPEARYLTTVRGYDEEGSRGLDAGPIEVVPGPVEQCSPELCQSSEFEIFWFYVPGDASGDSLVDLGDILFLNSYLYQGGPAPCIPEAGDPNGDCMVDLSDILYLISYLYKGGAPPLPGCWYGKK